ncbi:MAG: response regulator [Bdellovibrionales bacterium]|nr:response regulator [Bdellovibrionales bacterium]
MNVLIVDDEALIRRSLKRVFELKGHSVSEAENGVLGLKKWMEEKPDIVILDVLMPGLTGPQVLSEIGLKRKARVILVSAYTGEYDLKKAREMGADIFVPKPFENIFEIVKTAEGLLQKS